MGEVAGESYDDVGRLIRSARNKKSWNQHGLAEKIGKRAKETISQLERGSVVPSLELLHKLHDVLTDDKDRNATLVPWLLTWLMTAVKKESSLDPAKKEQSLAALENLLTAQLSEQKIWRKSGAPLTLEGFSHGAFNPLTVICGDRREPKLKTRGDIFALSVSISDVTFLPQINARDESTTIRSDKLFVLNDEKYLKREFGERNLLIVGSPAVNLGARRINNDSLFRFNLDHKVREFEKNLHNLKKLNDKKYLRVFWRMAQEWEMHQKELEIERYRTNELSLEEVQMLAEDVKRLLGDRSINYMMNELKKPGLIDPADAAVHGKNIRDDNDFAVISLARNPFSESDNYVCIMVAGIHGPGTAHALRALNEDDFKDHPFGGIIEVEIDPFKDWFSRFEKADWKWQTKPYTSDKILANLNNANEHEDAFSNLTDEDIKGCIAFVQQLSVTTRA